jgi:hypothetical protein
MATFAADTSVSVERSRAELERTLTRYKADVFGYATQGTRSMVQFTIAGRHVRFVLELPDRNSKQFTLTAQGRIRSTTAAMEAWEQACRQKWRALNLVVKAKLEAAEAGISTIEQEFLAHVVLPSGRTVWEETSAAIASSYELGQVQPLLALPSGGA